MTLLRERSGTLLLLAAESWICIARHACSQMLTHKDICSSTRVLDLACIMLPACTRTRTLH
jgi:hypothetical protein